MGRAVALLDLCTVKNEQRRTGWVLLPSDFWVEGEMAHGVTSYPLTSRKVERKM